MELKIGVIFGGKSGEHEVSLISASNIIEVMKKDYDIVQIGIDKDGNWMIYTGDNSKIIDGTWETDKKNLIKGFSILDHSLIESVDVFFPVLHGPNGEDGTVQGLLKLLNKPFVGCSVLSSAVGMDKVYSKIIFENAKLPIGDYMALNKSDWNKDKNQSLKFIEGKLNYPVFVKPANMGSSVGISKAKDILELEKGIKEAFVYDRKLIIEKAINCREIECAVLGNENPKASVLGEIIPSQEFYDYKSKYIDGEKSKLIIPADLNQEVTEKIREYAIRAFMAIDGRGLSRIDFFIEKGTEKIYINEINTLPGFTNISMYSKLWENSGISYLQLINELIRLALEEFNFN